MMYQAQYPQHLPTPLEARIRLLEALPEGWGGPDTLPPTKLIADNVRGLLKALPIKYVCRLHDESIRPSPNGTLVIDWENLQEELLSVEMGEYDAGFFSIEQGATQPHQR